MYPVNFPEANKVISRPESMTDEECASLQGYVRVNSRFIHFTTCWQIDKEELDRLKAKSCIVVYILSAGGYYVNIDTELIENPSLYAASNYCYWVPSEKQLKEIEEGKPVYLTFVSKQHPVIQVYVK